MREHARRLGIGGALGALAGLLIKDLGLMSALSFWHDRAPLVLVAFLVGALLFETRLRALVVAAASLLGALWIAVAFTPLCARLAAPLVRRDVIADQADKADTANAANAADKADKADKADTANAADQAAQADAVFVLSSRLQNDGELGGASMPRLLRALELLGQKRAPLLVLSELPAPAASYAAAARPLMQHLGLTQEILTIGPVGNTHDEAIALGKLAREKGWKRVLVVTSPTHTRRACAAIEQEGPAAAVCVPSTELGFDLETLDGFDERLRAFDSIAHEWIGLYVYRLRGYIPGTALPR